ncbi:MAG TPA: dTDP-4-amino-4,6-dideoxygalactose transaminase [Anaerolineales bacterium]|jgi:dTDP-4-amino-4,6-dideoxygalactose transaminase|nr:dTDP-4-amino-4,6-dideoxygalactose transaminase [Anaerolineales bacterium]HQX14830.1 dTDP-4-amino-4,6-dideoxygalactose transaminase [Anaerolineales bacterium]
MPIPFNRPTNVGNEIEYIQQAIQSSHLAGDGSFTKRSHAILEQAMNVPKALLTTSCTHALEMSALLLELKEGDEVIVPSFTFVSTINAFVLRGARAVFADVRPDTLNLDESKLEVLITPQTRAIVVVHYAGVGCEMDAIMEIANRHNIPVIEDNAHGLFGKYKGKDLGTFGVMATQSFHETKNLTSGEGGALLINDEKYFEDAEVLREKGTNRSRFFRGQVDKYTWVNLGSSYLPSEILAAHLLAQLEKREEIQSARKKIWETYYKELGAWAEENHVQMPFVPAHCEQTYHMFYMLFPNLEARTKAIAHLKERGVQAVFHYLPLHLSPMGEKYGGKVGDCPVTEQVSDQLIRLPFYTNMTEDEQKTVIAALKEFSV